MASSNPTWLVVSKCLVDIVSHPHLSWWSHFANFLGWVDRPPTSEVMSGLGSTSLASLPCFVLVPWWLMSAGDEGIYVTRCHEFIDWVLGSKRYVMYTFLVFPRRVGYIYIYRSSTNIVEMRWNHKVSDFKGPLVTRVMWSHLEAELTFCL